MHWLIQDCENIAPNSDNIIEACQQLGVGYSMVQYPGVIPCTHKAGMPYGSVQFARDADEWDDTLGVANYVFHTPAWPEQVEVWGDDFLNYDAASCAFQSVPKRERFFVKPEFEDKAFAGVVCTWDQYCKWRAQIIAGDCSGYSNLTPDTCVVYADVKPISHEYRFFVVDGEVVTGSLYREGVARRPLPFFDSPWYSGDIDDFARKRAREHWLRTYCLDIAVSDDKLKILEINCINSSGLYACDAVEIVKALEARYSA